MLRAAAYCFFSPITGCFATQKKDHQASQGLLNSIFGCGGRGGEAKKEEEDAIEHHLGTNVKQKLTTGGMFGDGLRKTRNRYGTGSTSEYDDHDISSEDGTESKKISEKRFFASVTMMVSEIQDLLRQIEKEDCLTYIIPQIVCGNEAYPDLEIKRNLEKAKSDSQMAKAIQFFLDKQNAIRGLTEKFQSTLTSNSSLSTREYNQMLQSLKTQHQTSIELIQTYNFYFEKIDQLIGRYQFNQWALYPTRMTRQS